MAYSDNIAVQVLTHNHHEVVADVLNNCAEHYKRCGIEIYYYDSSDNDETQKLIEDYISRGYDNLIYVRLEVNTNTYQKRDMVYSGMGLKKNYRYVWISKDRAYVDESALQEIIDTAEESYDVILTATRAGDKTYIDSAEELYHRWAPISSSMNAVILSRETILKDYSISNYDGYPRYMMDFGHFYILYEKLAHIQNPRIARIDMSKRIHNSELSMSTWVSEAFTVWKDSWIDVNDALPDIYDPYKDYIIKKVAGLPWILAERNRLIQLHEMGVLTPEMLPQALDRWERISDIPKEVVMAIANDEYDIRYDLTQIEDRGDFVRLLVEMLGYIREGKMTAGQIPLDDVAQAVCMELVKDDDKPRRNIKLGAAETVIEELKMSIDNNDNVRLSVLFQQLVAYIL